MLLVSLENNKRLDEESVKAEQNLDKEIAKLIDQFLEGKVPTFLDSRGPSTEMCLSNNVIHNAAVGQRESTKSFTTHKSMLMICF